MGLFDFFKKDKKEINLDSSLPKEMQEMIELMIKQNPQACRLDEIPNGFGDFGLEVTNPIPVQGIPSSASYLNNLRTKAGEKFTFNRIGSTGANNIECSIDQYEIYNLNGDTITTLYISPYHWKTSSKAPDGFINS